MAHTPAESDAPPLPARAAAAVALVALGAAVVTLFVLLRDTAVWLTGSTVCVVAGVAAAWAAATTHHGRRLLWAVAVLLFLAGLALLFAAGDSLIWVVVLAGELAVVAVAGNRALRWEVAAAVERRWRSVPAARRPVVLLNPKSGGEKVGRFRVVDEARRRGIEPVLLGAGDDLAALAEAAVDRGADVIGMAGGDGSLAVVASVAADRDVAFVCVPAGTRNHFALDLGVDRSDVVGALDAFGAAREARVDLATVNGRVFANNVSLGVYAEIVQSDAYRDAKAETVSALLPDLLGRDAPGFDLHVDGPDGTPLDGPQMLLVSNDPYRLDRLGGVGTRPRLDTGDLGVAALRVDRPADAGRFVALEAAGRIHRFPGWQEWTAPTLVVRSGSPVAAGVDGESLVLDPPLRFASCPGALRVRTAVHHPGMSPSAVRPGPGRSTFLGLARVLWGRPSGLFEGSS